MSGYRSSRFSITSEIVSFLMWLLCISNMSISIACVAIRTVSLPVKTSGISDDHDSLLLFSYCWYGITIFVSFIAALTDAGTTRYFPMVFLFLWDSARFSFIATCLIASRADSKIDPDERFELRLYLAWLLICICMELYCLDKSFRSIQDEYLRSANVAESDMNSILNRHFTPLAATTTVSEECELKNPLSRVFTRFRLDSPPSYSLLFDAPLPSDAEPPSYSSLKLSSASPSGQPAATSFVNVPGRPVGATFSTVEFPPPYEYQVGSGNSPIFCTSREQLQQPTDPDVSTHM